ncbi:DUF1684 domain-containing protein [Terracidiphilus gabretensis]|jgi:uncharacterized protein|uniref:DUF1684 domain-containing protein n=1 Tax=Terracidiphilus gabretensis TaxID=1577687 RepID=UPI00071B4D49|nr:DUF1684 domain-containing protein [Terracidiphilus gabretensis]
MLKRSILAVTLLASTAAAFAQTSAAPKTAADASAQWKQRIAVWRAQRDKELSAPDGWLTLIGLEWLKSGGNSFGAAADNSVPIKAQAPEHFGILTVSGKTIQLLSYPTGFPADFQINGKPAREGQLTTDGDNPSTMTWHGITMVVLARGDRYALRIKDANSPARTGFNGLHWYAPDLNYAVEAKWIPYPPGHTEKIPTIIGTTLNLPAPGLAEFTLNGKTLRLEPVIEDPHDSTLFFILRDDTSKTTTYEAARFLRTPFPDHGLDKPGTLILDFNQLYNPPCAYTPYATCPLPPPQNRLTIPIEAGEQRYSH